MVEQGEKQQSRRFTGIMRGVFWFFHVAGCLFVALLVIRLVLGINFLPIPSSDEATGGSAELTLKAMNIVLIFFTVVVSFLAFFGYREATEHQKLRKNLEEYGKKQKDQADEQRKELRAESDKRMEESRYASKLNLARIFLYLGAFDKASYVMNEIKEPLTYEAPLLRGTIACQSGDYGEALRFLEETLNAKPEREDQAKVYFYMGNAWMGLDDYEKAQANYDKCLKLAPNYPDAYVNKAAIRKRQEDIGGAIELVSRAIKINDKDSLCYFNRACYHSLKNERDKMQKDLEKAIELDRKWVYHALIDEDLKPNKDIVRKMLDP